MYKRHDERMDQMELRRYPPVAHFDGPEYRPRHDLKRLTGQIRRVYDVVRDGRWYTLVEIEERTGDPQASISAQLRHLRKDKFGGHVVEKRRRGDPKAGIYEYRLVLEEGDDDGAP